VQSACSALSFAQVIRDQRGGRGRGGIARALHGCSHLVPIQKMRGPPGWLGRSYRTVKAIDVFREHYNERRPSRAVHRSTPGQAYRALPKTAPASAPRGHCRLRYDHVDQKAARPDLRIAARNA